MYKGTTNVEHEMCDYTGNNRSHQNSNKRFKRNLEATTGKHSTDTLLATLHITWEVLQPETGSLSVGNHSWFTRNTRQ
jgi:hypothetical protein